jgi:hypothetical protein
MKLATYSHVWYEAWGGDATTVGGTVWLDDWSVDDSYNSIIGRGAPTNPRAAAIDFLPWQVADLMTEATFRLS